ncbi:LOW QUALITY PROTEIN: lysosomal acid glucosylceramidase-like [Panulirus ornatus]|uniref:LOW QUALITY PROTEIN: lysosomal acid glucosylceramidase-like n=1 Tax=Panulirus ornatus TaxID=150431 RepID=UPI003A851508
MLQIPSHSRKMELSTLTPPVMLLLLLYHQVDGTHVSEEVPCVPRDFGHSSFVCVCNSSYCDTLPTPEVPPEGQYLLYTSDLAGNRFHKTRHFFDGFKNNVSSTEAVVEFQLDWTTTFQTVMGWGGAFTDAATANILSLPGPAQDLLLSSYFSSYGLEYNIGRVNMGGCDFSWRTYTYVDEEGDVDLNTFALQPEDTEYKIPVIKRAEAMATRPLRLFASPWTAPPWMKTNNDFIGYGQLLPEMYQPWANYFVKFLEAYAAEDIVFWGITAQNEPIDGYVPGFFFNCMGWTAEEQRLFVAENLGPTLQAHGYAQVKLMILDDQRYELPKWAKEVLNDTSAAQYVDGIAIHWYGDSYTSPSRLDETHDLFPDYFILGTEACKGAGPLDAAVVLGSWERCESYAHDIIIDMNHWVTGWVDWNLALDMEGGPNWAKNFVDSPIIVNKEKEEFYKNPMFYAMGHFSKFVKEGALRVSLTSPDSKGLDAVAFKNRDDTTAIILLNRSKKEMQVGVRIHQRGTIFLTVGPRSLHTAFYV